MGIPAQVPPPPEQAQSWPEWLILKGINYFLLPRLTALLAEQVLTHSSPQPSPVQASEGGSFATERGEL